MYSERENARRMMSEKQTPDEQPIHLQCYEIRVKGHISDRLAEWFEGLTITLEVDGDTLLTGPVVDQAALHGLLKKVRDLGMPLVLVRPLEAGPSMPHPGQCGASEADRSDV
jgi:hypothetical protein